MDGYIKLHRGLQENILWLSEPFTKGQAWIDLLLLTNYKPSYLKYRNGEMVKINRGECGYSIEFLSKRWKWSRGKVKRYFTLLENEKMIHQKIGSKSTVIKVLNFEQYQKRTSNDTSNGHQTDTNKEREEREEGLFSLSNSSTRARAGKREREILEAYCKRTKRKSPNGFIRKVIENGDYVRLIQEEKEHQCKIRQKQEQMKIYKLPEEKIEKEDPGITQEAFEQFRQKIEKMRREGSV